MQTSMTSTEPEPMLRLPSRRGLAAPLFRHRRAVVRTFITTATLAVLGVLLLPSTYEAEMTVLVDRARIDPLMTGDAVPGGAENRAISESELYVEVELIGGREVLERVVKTVGLDRFVPPGFGAPGMESARLAEAVKAVREDLTVEPLRRTTLIRVAYRSPDRDLAARVMNELSTAYVEKHLQVHRPAGAADVFSTQLARAQQELEAAKTKLSAFTRRERVVAAGPEKDMTLQKVSEFEAEFQRTQATMSDMRRRLTDVEQQMRTTPERHVTQVRDTGNIELQRTLKNQILQLEMSRAQMLDKFTPQYPPLVQVEENLTQLRAALESAERAPLRDQTSDQNPTFAWLRAESARARTEGGAAAARASALRRSIGEYEARARQLEALSLEQNQLLRDVKVAEDKVDLYRRKQEENRVADALDSTRIANVAIAEAPAVPDRPAGLSRSLLLAVGLTMAIVLSIGMAYLRAAMDPVFHTGDDVSRFLGIPVLATIPATAMPRPPAALHERAVKAIEGAH